MIIYLSEINLCNFGNLLKLSSLQSLIKVANEYILSGIK